MMASFLKNIVPIILVAIIVFFVFNLLQNKSFNPLFEGMDGSYNDIAKDNVLEISGNITDLESEIINHKTSDTGNHNHRDLNATINNLSTRISGLSQHDNMQEHIANTP